MEVVDGTAFVSINCEPEQPFTAGQEWKVEGGGYFIIRAEEPGTVDVLLMPQPLFVNPLEARYIPHSLTPHTYTPLSPLPSPYLSTIGISSLLSSALCMPFRLKRTVIDYPIATGNRCYQLSYIRSTDR